MMMVEYFKRLTKSTVSKVFNLRSAAVFGLSLGVALSSGTAASAQQALQNVRLFTNGSCGETTSSQFLVQIISVPTQFTTADETIVFPGGQQQPQDILVFYTTDANNTIIGRSAQAFPTQTDLANDLFFAVQQRPTVAGNFTVRAADETDRTPDRALGSTFTGGVLTTSFNAAGLDPDCVPLPAAAPAPVPLSLVRSAPAAQTTNSDTLRWRLTFDRAVLGLGANDFTVSGTTATLAVTGSGTTFDLTLSGGNLAGLNGGVSIGISSTATFTNTDGVAYVPGTNPATNESTYIVDNARDTVEVRSSSTDVSAPFLVSVEVTGVGPASPPNCATGLQAAVDSAISITNGTRTNAIGGSCGGTTYTFGVAPGNPGPLTISLPAGGLTDTAGNPSTASNTLNITVLDITPPAISVPSAIQVSTDPGQATAVVNYTLSANDNVDGAVTPQLVSGPASGGAFPVGVTTVTYRAVDAAGNQSQSSFNVTVTDDEAPQLSVPANITVDTDPGQSTAVVNYTVTASDNVDGSLSPALTAGLPSGSAFPLGTTSVSFRATDAAGNATTDSFTVTVSDNEGPTLTGSLADVTVAADPGTTTASVNVLPLVNGAFSASDNADASPTLIVTVGQTSVTGARSFPLGSTEVSVIAEDADGNRSSPPATFNVIVTDQENPVVTPPADTTVEAGPGDVANVSFSATAADNVDGSITPTFTLGGNAITSPFDFPVGTNVVTASATDSAGNTGTAQFSVTVTPAIAPVAPTITTSLINRNRSLTIGGTAEPDSTVRVVFPDNTVRTVTASGGVYQVTSASDMIGGTVTVTATDAAGNTSAMATVGLFPDYENPTVTITGAPDRVIDTTPFTISIAFSETVFDFDQSDINVTGATITSFSGSDADYSAVITPIAGALEVVISIAEGAASDAFTNESEASNIIRITNDALTETEEMIVRATADRSRAASRAQPHLSRFMRGGATGDAMVTATRDSGFFDFSTSAGRNVWAQGQGSWATNEGLESGYAHLSFGAHVDVNENFLLGAMLQVDRYLAEEEDMTFEASGTLVGPYAVARLSNQPLIFSGSYLVGRSENTISPLGTYEDTFDSERSVFTLGVVGEMELGGVKLLPLLDYVRSVDETDAYIDGDSNPVRAQTVTLDDITIGLDVEMPVEIDSGDLLVLGGFSMTSSRYEDAVEATQTDFGEISLGFSYAMDGGARITGRATYSGLGDDNYEAVSGALQYEVRF